MKTTILVLIAVLAVGGSIIAYGFMINQEVEVKENSTPYEKLKTYKNELEKINQYNQNILKDLESKITDSEDANLEQIREEIQVLKRVIDENKAELELVIQKLSKMQSNP